MFVKWISSATLKIELLLSINLLLCTPSRVLTVVQIMWEILNITSLGPALFPNDSNIGNAANRNSRINLVIANPIIIDRFKNLNILLFKEALKINEIKPTLNKGLKASKELQLF